MPLNTLVTYTIQCDATGCSYDLGEWHDEFASWLTEPAALAEWAEVGGTTKTEFGDVRFYCPDHAENGEPQGPASNPIPGDQPFDLARVSR